MALIKLPGYVLDGLTFDSWQEWWFFCHFHNGYIAHFIKLHTAGAFLMIRTACVKLIIGV
jgi:hypothetical protein